MSDQVETLRELAAVSAEDLACIDAHVNAVDDLVKRFELRWEENSKAGGDPRLQYRHFGNVWLRFPGNVARVVLARLEHRLHAEHSPFRPEVSPQLSLREVARHDQLAIEAHCTEFERQERRRFG